MSENQNQTGQEPAPQQASPTGPKVHHAEVLKADDPRVHELSKPEPKEGYSASLATLPQLPAPRGREVDMPAPPETDEKFIVPTIEDKAITASIANSLRKELNNVRVACVHPLNPNRSGGPTAIRRAAEAHIQNAVDLLEAEAFDSGDSD